MKYNLRVCIHPDSWEKQMEDLIWACKYANIEEVLLCEHPYEIAPIIQPLSYHKRMKEVFLEVVPILQENGISSSFYIKASVGHGDRFNVDELTFPFQKFTGVSLKESHHTPCVLDPDWQHYIVQVMSEYAICNFDKIMIDDDFNSVNHDTGPTGCFCSLHAKEVSKLVGTELDSEKLFFHVTHNDKYSMKVRKAWMDLTYKGQLKAISAMEKAIHDINPQTLFGIMNSSNSAHAMQGRKMRELLQAAAGESNPPLSRPGGGAYRDSIHDGIIGMHNNTAKCIASQGDGIIYASEIENFPRNIFSKSKKQLDLHMRIQSITGVSELTLNIFDHFQTPISYSMEYLDLLKSNKDKYDELEMLSKGKRLKGIGFPWKEDISYKLINRKNSASQVGYRIQLDVPFQRMGFPVQYTEGDINCIEGDLVRCYSDEELEQILAKGLILDCIAAKNLCERGFGDLIGVNFVEEFSNSFFEIFDNEDYNKNYINQYAAVLNGNDGSVSAYKFLPSKDATIASQVMNKDKEAIAPGTILFTNKLGGKICVFATPYVDGVNWNIKCRQEQLQNIIKWLSGDDYDVLVEESINVMPLHYGGTGGDLLALVNTGFDEQNVRLTGKLSDKMEEKRIELNPFEMKVIVLP